jgi:hypothetical protein
MKLKVLLLLVLVSHLQTNAQTQSRQDSISLAQYQNFMYRLLGFNVTSPIGSFVFEATENPALKLNGVFRRKTENYSQTLFKKYYGGFSGVLTSKNKYTPIISKDKWAPDASFGINNYFFPFRSVSFYDDDVESFADTSGSHYEDSNGKLRFANGSLVVNHMPIQQASSIYMVWFNNYIGYNYSQLNVLTNRVSLSTDTVFDKIRNRSFVASLGINGFAYPSKKKWISLLGSANYMYKTNDNNYNNLTDVTVKTFTTYNSGTGSLEIQTDELKGKTGKFRIGNTHNFITNLGFILSPSDKLYIGVTGNFQRTVASSFQYTDLGFTINVPITQQKDKEKTLANFALKFDFPDVNGEIDATKTMKEKRRVGFLVSFPLMPSPRQR